MRRGLGGSPAGYTRGAIDLAKSTGVSLYDADTIHQWIRKVDKIEKERAQDTAGEKTPWLREHAHQLRARRGQDEGCLASASRRPAGAPGRFA